MKKSIKTDQRKRDTTGYVDLPTDRLLAAQLDFAGQDTNTIAAACGVHRCTLWKWRQTPEYQMEIENLKAESRRAIVGEAIRLRTSALRALGGGLEKMREAIEGGTVGATDLAPMIRAAESAYRTFCSQTGMDEPTRIEHSGVVETGPQVVVRIAPSLARDLAIAEDDGEE